VVNSRLAVGWEGPYLGGTAGGGGGVGEGGKRMETCGETGEEKGAPRFFMKGKSTSVHRVIAFLVERKKELNAETRRFLKGRTCVKWGPLGIQKGRKELGL